MPAISAPLRPAVPRLSRRPQEARRAVQAPREPDSWLPRWLRRRKPTTYHRCLAIHMHFAGPRSALS